MITLRGATAAVTQGDGSTVTVLDIPEFNLARSEWIALVGANGAGKSTLLRVLAGLQPLRTGTLGHTPARPRVALVLQEPDDQLVATSVERELDLSIVGPADAAERRRRLLEAANRFHLGNLLARNPHRLSGGEKQRLVLATVWLQEPDVVLFDEPTSYLDHNSARLCDGFARELRERGTGIVWAMPSNRHIGDADRVMWIDAGTIAFDGTREQWALHPMFRRFEEWTGRGKTSPAAPGEVVVSLNDVTFAYDATPVLVDVSLDVRTGECVGITGANSTGKSTLLLVAGGVFKPSRGRVIRASTLRGLQPVFYMPQSPERLFFAETVLEELAFGLRRLGLAQDDIKRRAGEALHAVGLDAGDFLLRDPFRLSFGEMRRVAYAVTVALDPDLALLDEPTACVDNEGIDVLARLLDTRRRNDRASVVASHDGDFLASVCNRILDVEEMISD